ncbi:chymotrypsin-like protease CTRL-1 isoform X3 [Macaca fascicularis]|uniref:chymotrypsin-like protease CTRL-1 isoform X3 n=1 Tax=Macaca fascicularis TaxID=9541 RepID=UPI0003AB986C
MARLRCSCHQTSPELQPEDCQRGECSTRLLALAGVPAGQQRLPLLRWFSHQPVLGGHCCPLQCQAITHPSWNPTTMNNDVTLLKLASPAQYTTRISPVCLASSNEALTEGLTCVTTGWGRLSGVGNVTPARLQQVALPLVTVNQCRQYWGSDITDSMICAGGAGASSCQGDSGGPLVCQKGNTWVLIGIVSWGTKNCNVRAPAVYTRVSKFSAWINQVIAYN